MTESDTSTGGTDRVPPLNLTERELQLARGLVQPEGYITDSWPEEDVEALHSLDQKLDTAYRSLQTATEQ